MNQALLTIAIEAALEAAKKILEIYQSDDFDIQLKSDDSPLTKADIASHNIIESYLKNTQIPILSEEGKDIPYQTRKEWSKLWIVDPIDGTKEFIKRNGEFTVNIALVENQQPILGVIYAPILNDLYFSLDGMGA
ncbi:3'(2'),5'-bisphosphate nucleotidase CysQ, partial [bacterium]|nr:3'(2'),5'-bisphosphate nucleotidase CysQ [bacterium]